MTDKLPYTLTEGVTATREGLFFDGEQRDLSEFFGAAFDIDGVADTAWQYGATRSPGDYWLPWPDAAERLRYREGEPWCWYWPEFDVVRNEPSCQGLLDYSPDLFLHRLAAILCDDADAFRVLHWCVTNLEDRERR